MRSYDPDQAPDPAQWRAIDEGVRMGLVMQYHRAARIRLPKPNLHYAVHVVVENQIADGMPAVLRAMARLQEQGLSRHDALHAIAVVAAHRVTEQLRADDPRLAATFEERYGAELDQLSADDWRRMAEATQSPPAGG